MLDPDGYGHEIWDCYSGKDVVEIVERDDGLIDPSSDLPRGYFAGYGDWPEYEKEAMKLVVGRVLDIGCGAGRHCLYLQDRGHEVVGLDISPLAIRVCRERGVRDARCMSITQVGSSLGRFDTILLMCNNFGLLGGMARAKWLLRRFKAITTPQARIIGASADPYKTTNPSHLEYHKLNRRRGRMPGQVRIRIRYQRYASGWFDYLLVSPEEMKSIVEGTGWQVDRFITTTGPQYIGVLNRTAQ